MYGIDTSTSVAEMPAPAAANPSGFCAQGDPSTGSQSTQLSADWFNIVTKELLNILQAATIAPSKTVFNQVLSAIQYLIGVETTRAEAAEAANATAITNETTRAEAAEAANAAAVVTERTRAETAEAANATAIATETTNRGTAVTTEATARANADTSLLGDINAEIARAEAAEASLLADINAEITRAEGAESTISAALPVCRRSGFQTFSAGVAVVFDHGLGAVPDLVMVDLVCVASGGNAGYAQGERLSLNPGNSGWET